MKNKEKKEKEYEVVVDVFFMVHKYVTAKSKKEAIEMAFDQVNYGEGEEKTLYSIEIIK